jgi:hypothetical protein
MGFREKLNAAAAERRADQQADFEQLMPLPPAPELADRNDATGLRADTTSSQRSTGHRLRELDALRQSNVISEAEYPAKRAHILDDL